MPYHPGVTDRSGEILAAGIGGASDAIVQAMDEAKKLRDQDALLRAHLSEAVASGAIEPDEGAQLVSEFYQGNHRKKMEIGLQAQLASKRFENEAERKPIELTPEEVDRYTQAGGFPLRTGPKSFAFGEPKAKAFVPTAEDVAQAKAAGQIYARGRLGYQLVPDPAAKAKTQWQFDPAKHIVPLPGDRGVFIQQGPGGGGSILPAKGGTGPQFVDVDDGGGGTVRIGVNPDGSWKPLTPRKAPGEALTMDDKKADIEAARWYAVHGQPTLESLVKRRDTLLLQLQSKTPPSTGDLISDGGAMGTFARLNREIGRMNAKAEAGVRASAPKPGAKAPVKAAPISSANSKAINNSLPLPQNDPVSTEKGGDALPPLPDKASAVKVATPAEAEKLPPGTLYERPDGQRFFR